MELPIYPDSQRWKSKHDPITEFRSFLRDWMDMYFQDPPENAEQKKLQAQAKDFISIVLKGRASVEHTLKEYDREVRNKSKDIKLKHPDLYFRRQKELYIYKILRDLHKDMYQKEFRSFIDRDGDYIMPYVYELERYQMLMRNKGVY
uniref:Uncharacterized protein n=2 Tax=Psilocybe cubensis TaxID=181762 RepID=A0A8H7XMD7_PSICU